MYVARRLLHILLHALWAHVGGKTHYMHKTSCNAHVTRVVALQCSGAWYEGFVFRYRLVPAMGGQLARQCFQVFYLEDEDEEWFDWPEGSLVFSDARPETARVPAAKLTEALRMHAQARAQ